MMPRRLLLILISSLLLAACSEPASDRVVEQPASSPAGDFVSATGPGLTVGEALDSTLDQFLLVNGYLLAKGDDVFLCSALAESYPPQCGGDRLRVVGLDLDSVTGLETHEGTAWSPGHVQVLGTVTGGVMTVAGTVSG